MSFSPRLLHFDHSPQIFQIRLNIWALTTLFGDIPALPLTDDSQIFLIDKNLLGNIQKGLSWKSVSGRFPGISDSKALVWICRFRYFNWFNGFTFFIWKWVPPSLHPGSHRREEKPWKERKEVGNRGAWGGGGWQQNFFFSRFGWELVSLSTKTPHRRMCEPPP